MKKYVSLIIILILIITNGLSFLLGIVYFSNKNRNFNYSINNQTTLLENRQVWGKPDRIDYNEYEIIDTYYPMLPVNEYKFFLISKIVF